MTDQEKKGSFKNEVGREDIDESTFFESFSWEGPIVFMTRFLEKLTDMDIDYAIESDNREKCFNIYVNKGDKQIAIDALEE